MKVSGDWSCAQEDDALVISPKTYFIAAVICGSAVLGGSFVVVAIALPDRPDTTLYHRLGLLVFGAVVASLGSISTYFGCGEWRLNPRAIEFHYFYRRKMRPAVLEWKDVDRLRMLATGWAFRGKDSKAFVPLLHLSWEDHQKVNTFLRETLSPHFDLTTKPIPGRKFFKFFVAPQIGIFALMTGAFILFRLYLNNPALHQIVRPIVVLWLIGLWLLVVISLYICHAIILGRQANKDNPWRYRRDHQAAMIHEYEILKN